MNAEHPFSIDLFSGWLACGERGLSSEAIVQRLTGVRVSGRFGEFRGALDHPWDAGDFRRCEMLLRETEIARLGLPLMADVSPEWKALADHWAELVAIGEAENPDLFTKRAGGSAPNLYARMCELLAESKVLS